MKVNYENLLLITENLYNLYYEGVDIAKAIKVIEDLPLNKSYKKSLISIENDILKGLSLSDGMKRFPKIYPKIYIGLIAVGEKSGRLSQVLFSLIKYTKKKSLIKKKLISASVYPALMISMLILFIIISFFFIIPIFIDNLGECIDKNAYIYKMYEFRNTIIQNSTKYIIGTLIFIALVAFVVNFLKSKEIISNLLCKIRIVNLYYENILMTILEIIFNSTLSLIEVMDICISSIEEGNIKNDIELIYHNIIKGESVYASMEGCKFISSKTREMIKVSESGGYIDKSISRLQERTEIEFNEYVEKMLRKIEPASIISIAVFVAIFLIVFIVPMLTSVNNVS